MRCSECGRKALFKSTERFGAKRLHSDKKHDLCFRCARKYFDASRKPKTESRDGDSRA